MNGLQINLIKSEVIQFTAVTTTPRCVECHHSTRIEHSNSWSHSYSTNTWTILADRATTTSWHCDTSGIHWKIKLSWPSFAVWLVPTSITATLSSLECRNQSSPNCNEYRTRWHNVFHVVESLITLRQLERTLRVTGSISCHVQNNSSGKLDKENRSISHFRQFLQDYEPLCSLRSTTKSLIC